MPDNSYPKDQNTKSSRRRNRSSKDNDSTKTHRGSPVPQPPDVSSHTGGSATTHNDKYNLDVDLLGFGAQFDDKK
ncbi:hypothetical protein F4781DRAFT_429698 [Annulohypoxylon bovei var. microspora]|nr:hypothetical protein F4781DRAFT_429698 [Annulohypoxylon bovei var. microspora]